MQLQQPECVPRSSRAPYLDAPRRFRRNSGSPTFSCCKSTARPPCWDSLKSPETENLRDLFLSPTISKKYAYEL